MKGNLLGVLGGMGPLASAFFVMRITQLTAARTDQDHLPIVLWSNPDVPDRTLAWLRNGPSPLPHLREGIQALVKAGANMIAIPCNTAHAWYQDMLEDTDVPILHIADALIDDLRELPSQPVVGLLGTAATLKMGLYQERLKGQGVAFVVPSETEITRLITPCIAALKAGHFPAAFQYLASTTEHLQAAGATAIALACTELPLLQQEFEERFPDLHFISSVDALAKAALRRARLPMARRSPELSSI